MWNKLGATLANSSDAHGAIEAYFNALAINPSYIRARYNLAIASIQLGSYKEAAEHLLGALSIQSSSTRELPLKEVANRDGILWSALKMLMDSYIRRTDLMESCDNKDLDAFRGDFDF